MSELYLKSNAKQKVIENLKKADEMFQEMEMKYWLTKTRQLLNKL